MKVRDAEVGPGIREACRRGRREVYGLRWKRNTRSSLV